MYKIGTLTDSTGGVLLHGDVTPIRLSSRDSYVSLIPGKRVVVSDMDQGNNQWAAVRTLDIGTPPAPPVGLETASDLSAIIAQLANSNTWVAAWAKTVRYSLSHFAGIVPAITGTAYATIFRRPLDWRLMLPIRWHEDVGPIGGSLVNLVAGGPGEPPIIQEQPARILGPGSTIQDPRTFTYGPIPEGAAAPGGTGYWPTESGRVAGLPGGASVGPDAQVSTTVACLFLGVGATSSILPTLPANVSPRDVYGEPPPGDLNTDVGTIEAVLSRQMFEPSADIPAIVFIGAQGEYTTVGTSYSEATQTFLRAIRTS